MGTRGLTVVKIDGQTKVAQYGQWDHYPGGQGLTALEFLRDSANLEALRAKAPHVRPISDQEFKDTWTQVGADPDSSLVSYDIAQTHSHLFPHLSRDTGAGILALVAENPEGLALRLAPEFANDGLFCEGIFTVDFDANTFSYHRNGYESEYGNGKGIEPVSFPLDNLPSDEDFAAAANAALEAYYGDEGDED